MKDKLSKHHLPKSYFLRKKITIISLIVLALTASIALPVGITIYYQRQLPKIQKQINIVEKNKNIWHIIDWYI